MAYCTTSHTDLVLIKLKGWQKMPEVETLTPDEEKLIEDFYEEVDTFVAGGVAFPPCPQGGQCDCPKQKVKLGYEGHNCDPNPESGCVVLIRVFKKGLRK